MLLEAYLDTVVSGFGLKAEGPLGVGVGGPAGALVLALVCQGDLIAALLLHALRQAADGDLAAHTEPGVGATSALYHATWQLGNNKDEGIKAVAQKFRVACLESKLQYSSLGWCVMLL